MRDRGYVGDAGDLVAASIQSANGGLAARARALDVDVQVLQTVFQGSLAGTLGRYLGSERGALTRAAETGTTGGRPGQCVALTVGDGHDGVVERRVDVGDPIDHCLFDFLTGTSSRFCHD